MVRFHRIFFELLNNLNEWNAAFKSKTDNTSHLELCSIENVSLSQGEPRLFLQLLHSNT